MTKTLLLLVSILFLFSCDRAVEKRRYQEVVIKNESPHPMTGMEGDPHAFMHDMGQMPDGEDPHAFMREGAGMPSSMQEMKNMPVDDALMASVTKAPLEWKTPEGWQEKPGSGMRVATFLISQENASGECSIISLGPSAGSLESNASRWAGQINVAFESSAQLTDFLSSQKSFQTVDATPFKIVDFTPLQEKQDDAAVSMMAAILAYPDKTVFIKLTGSKGLVAANREKFKQFCQSLKLKN